LALGALKNIS